MKNSICSKQQAASRDLHPASCLLPPARYYGFTLIETLVAVTILTLSVAGPMMTANRAIVAAQTSRDQLTASYLAQEGIEFVRAMRDREYLALYPGGDSSAAWNAFLGTGAANGIEDYCLSPASCTLDPQRSLGYGSGFAIATYGGNAPLYLTNCTVGVNGLSCTPPNLYTQQNLAGSVQTAFTRTIQVFHLTDTDERIVSTVSWTFHGTPYSVSISVHLTPWQ